MYIEVWHAYNQTNTRLISFSDGGTGHVVTPEPLAHARIGHFSQFPIRPIQARTGRFCIWGYLGYSNHSNPSVRRSSRLYSAFSTSINVSIARPSMNGPCVNTWTGFPGYIWRANRIAPERLLRLCNAYPVSPGTRQSFWWTRITRAWSLVFMVQNSRASLRAWASFSNGPIGSPSGIHPGKQNQ